MRLLLDTHVLLWWLSDDRKLAKTSGREIIANPNNDVFVSSASVWEVAIKAALGRMEIELDDLENAIARNGFRSLIDRVQACPNGRPSTGGTPRSVRSNAGGSSQCGRTAGCFSRPSV